MNYRTSVDDYQEHDWSGSLPVFLEHPEQCYYEDPDDEIVGEPSNLEPNLLSATETPTTQKEYNDPEWTPTKPVEADNGY